MRVPQLAWLMLLAATVQTASAQNQPFGLTFGMSKAEVKKLIPGLKVQEDMVYLAPTVPRPNSKFEAYMLVITPKHGLCKEAAISETYRHDDFGNQTRATFDRLKGTLTQKYGEPKVDVDSLKPESLWDKPDYWMMALYKEERAYFAVWYGEGDDTTPIDESVANIVLEAKAASMGSGYVRLTYEGTNFAACLKEMRKEEGSGL